MLSRSPKCRAVVGEVYVCTVDKKGEKEVQIRYDVARSREVYTYVYHYNQECKYQKLLEIEKEIVREVALGE